MLNVIRTDEPIKETQDTLEKVLVELTLYGKPRVSYQGDGWCSTIEMNTNSSGVSFDVKSDFKQPSPIAAVLQCRSRMLEAISQYRYSK